MFLPSYIMLDPGEVKSPAQIQRMYARVQAAYDSGTSFFTKEAFRQVVQAFDRNDPVIRLTGVDGTIVGFRLRDEEDAEPGIIIKEPYLKYHRIQQMTGQVGEPWSLHHQVINLPIAVLHNAKDTTELMPLLPKERVERMFQLHNKQWLASQTFARLKVIFAGQSGTALPPRITKVVAYACGSMAPAARDAECRSDLRRSIWQHAMVLSIRDFLLARCGNAKGEVRCFAQDPIYEDVDKVVLDEAGVSVLHDPRAHLEVDETSVVVGIAPMIPLRQIVADIARPAVLIWARIVENDNPAKADPASSRVKRMIQEDYVEVECPFSPAVNCKFGMAVYVRKT